MKTCPYCAEDIQDEAIKCKHCGEWLDKSKKDNTINTLKGFYKKSKDTIDAKRSAITEKRYAHLYNPSDEMPLVISEVVFSSQTFNSKGKEFFYSDIASLYYSASVSSTNGMMKDKNYELLIFMDIGTENFPIEKRIDKMKIKVSTSSFAGLGAGKKEHEKVAYISNYLHNITFQTRIARYVDLLKTQDFIDYTRGYRIYMNGDIYRNGKFKANLMKSYKNNCLSFGNTRFGGVRANIEIPYGLYIWSENAIANSIWNAKVSIDIEYDKDIISGMIYNLINSGSVTPVTE